MVKDMSKVKTILEENMVDYQEDNEKMELISMWERILKKANKIDKAVRKIYGVEYSLDELEYITKQLLPLLNENMDNLQKYLSIDEIDIILGLIGYDINSISLTLEALDIIRHKYDINDKIYMSIKTKLKEILYSTLNSLPSLENIAIGRMI